MGVNVCVKILNIKIFIDLIDAIEIIVFSIETSPTTCKYQVDSYILEVARYVFSFMTPIYVY